MKVRTSVLIERDLLEKAKRLGLSISQCLENCLKLYIQALENANKQMLSTQVLNEEKAQKWCSGRDSNPRIRPQLTDGTRVCGSRGRHT